MISIIIPTYNRSKLLLECLNSILNQTCKNFEILIIDDGSTDDTEYQVLSLNETKIVYHKLDKIGNISFLRNYGIERSKGDFVAFCDDDDIWFPNKLFMQLKMMEKFDIVCSNAVIINLDGIPRRELIFKELQNNIALETKHLLFRNYVITSSVLVNKKILGINPFNAVEYKSTAEDYELWLKLSLNYQIGLCSEPLIKYRVHSNLTFRDDNLPIVYYNSIYLVKKYLKYVSENDKQYGYWGMNKFRFLYTKLILSRYKVFKAILNFLKIIWNFHHISFAKQVVYSKIYPKKSIEKLILNSYKIEYNFLKKKSIRIILF